MSLFPLHLFPENSLAASVTTTVWIGVWVVAFYNLRLGWTLSGLVVPGYLVPLLLVKPIAAGVILAEAILTYVIVATISEYRQVKPWTSFFGRDRFFALVLVSILVRGAMDGFILPVIGDTLTFHYGWQFSFRDDLHSFGLIIVSLVANYFWKPGIARGFIPLAVTVGTTYLIVRFGLVEWTNFSVGNLQYMYEEIASSLLACPKAYIVLVTTAYIASQMNLYYGWDFNGILIPALLALQWQEPFKLVTTFGESFVVLGVATALLKLPVFQRTTMEGARKMLLFFNIAFGFRLLVGYVAPLLLPEVKVSDLFGFGYLLSSLLAVRMHDSGLLLRIPRVSLQVSLVGAVAGTMIGFLMTRAFDAWTGIGPTPLITATTAAQPNQTLIDLIRRDKPRLYRHQPIGSQATPQPDQLAAFSAGIAELLAFCGDTRDSRDLDNSRLRRARTHLQHARFELVIVDARYLLIRETEPINGWGTYVIDIEHPDGLLVEVPNPRAEFASAEAGLVLFERLSGRALAIGGADPHNDRKRTVEVLSHQQTIFGAFHRALAAANVLLVRGERDEQREQLRGDSTLLSHAASSTEPSRLWVTRSLPASLDLKRLEELVPDFRVEWQPSPRRNVLRDAAWAGYAELQLNRSAGDWLLVALSELGRTDSADSDRADGWHALRLGEGRGNEQQRHQQKQQQQPRPSMTQGVPHMPLDSDRAAFSASPLTMGGWMRNEMELVLERGSQTYRPALQEELFYFDEEVIQPLLAIALSGKSRAIWTDQERGRVVSAAAAASVLNYRLQLLVDHETGGEVLALAEHPIREQRRGWGAYLFRIGQARPCGIEIPRPGMEQWTSEYGLSLFRSLNASILMVAGAHPQTNRAATADVVLGTNALTLFNTVRQVVIREVDPQPWRQIQVRGLSEPTDVDVLAAPSDPLSNASAFDDVLDRLKVDNLKVRLTDGTEETAGFESSTSLLGRSLRLGRDVQGLILWLSPNLRMQFRGREDDALQAAEFQAVQIPTVPTSIVKHLSALLKDRSFKPCDVPFQQIASRYLASRDVIELRRLQQLWREATWTRILDVDSGQTYLIGHDTTRLLVICLAELPSSGPNIIECDQIMPETVREFLDRRATWMQTRRSTP